MPDSVRDHLHAVCLLIGVVVGIVGVLWLRAAVTFEHHLGAFILVTIAGVFIFGAYRLKPDETARDLDALGRAYGKSESSVETKRDT